MNRSRLVLLSSFCLLGIACRDPASDAASTASGSAAKSGQSFPTPPPVSTAPLPPRFTGTLTVELVEAAKGSLPAPKPLREALGDLEAKLGAPTRTRQATTIGPKRTWYYWAAANETKCATYSAVEQPDLLPGWPSKLVDDSAKSIAIPAHVIADPSAKEAPDVHADWRRVAECLEVVGKTLPMPPDDPKGKPPGASITHAELMQGLYLAPSLWIGKTVTVRGKLKGAWGTILQITATGETDEGKTIDCKVPAGEKAVEPEKAAEAITVMGVVQDPRIPLEGENGHLVDCKVAK